MGYVLRGVIGRRKWLERLSTTQAAARLCTLDDEFALIPLADDLYDAWGPATPALEATFGYLTESLVAWLCEGSRGVSIAFVEAEYFGGAGTQAAVVFSDGKVGAAIKAPRAIDGALRELGVIAVAPMDEFDTLCLGRHRQLERWVL